MTQKKGSQLFEEDRAKPRPRNNGTVQGGIFFEYVRVKAHEVGRVYNESLHKWVKIHMGVNKNDEIVNDIHFVVNFIFSLIKQ